MKDFVDSYGPMPGSAWKEIRAAFQRRTVKKGDYLLQEGQVCRTLSFLESGLLRFYILNDGQEVTKFFTVAPYFYTSQVSFNSGKPAKENIQAMEDSVIWEVTFTDNEQLLSLPAWNGFGRKITQEVQFFTEEILEELQTETAEQRYRNILDRQPELALRVPLKHLASYLGIAPQSLSRIRKRLARDGGT